MSICSPKLTVNELYKSLSKIKDKYGDYEVVAVDDATKLMRLNLINENAYLIQDEKKIYILGNMLG